MQLQIRYAWISRLCICIQLDMSAKLHVRFHDLVNVEDGLSHKASSAWNPWREKFNRSLHSIWRRTRQLHRNGSFHFFHHSVLLYLYHSLASMTLSKQGCHYFKHIMIIILCLFYTRYFSSKVLLQQQYFLQKQVKLCSERKIERVLYTINRLQGKVIT